MVTYSPCETVVQEASMFALWRHKHTDTRCCFRNLWSQLGVFLSPQTSLPFKFATFNAESSHFTSGNCCRAVWYCLHTSYTECLRGNLPYFRRSFPRLNDVDVTKGTYTRSWTITDILKRYKMWSPCGSTYCVCWAWRFICTSRKFVPVPTAKPSDTAARVLRKILRNLRKIFRKRASFFLISVLTSLG